MVKKPLANAGDSGNIGLIPGSGRSPGEGNCNPVQLSCLEISTDRRAQRATVHGVSKSWKQLSMCTEHSLSVYCPSIKPNTMTASKSLFRQADSGDLLDNPKKEIEGELFATRPSHFYLVENKNLRENGRTDAEAEVPIRWPTWFEELTHWKTPDSGKDSRQEEKGMVEDEMVGWHHWLKGHEFEQAPGVGDWQGSLDMLQSMELQSIAHDWMTELNWLKTEWIIIKRQYFL